MKVRKITNLPVQDNEGRVYYTVRVDTDAGIHGLGEVGISNWGRAIANAVDHLGELVIGADPWDTERLWQEMFRSGYFPADKVYCCAISAIDIALWDIKGKSVNMPTYKLLGGQVREKVVCYPHIRGTDKEQIVEGSKRAVGEGWKFVRWGQPDPWGSFESGGISIIEPDKSMRLAVELMGEVREAVGPDIELMIDCHARFDAPTAIRLARSLEQYNIWWMEEPVGVESTHALKQVRENVSVPICVGERLHTRWDFLPILENELADFIMPDVTWTGGISEIKKIATMAEAYYVPISPHDASGPINVLAGAHAMASVPNHYRVETTKANLSAYNAYIDHALDVRGDKIYLSDRPGLGIELDKDFMRAHVVAGYGG